MQRDMEYIRMVYKTGSFSKAAEVLFAAQPTVSMAVQRVEEELGTRLFERGTSPLRPTVAGMRYLAHADRIAQSEMQLQHELEMISSMHSEEFRIGCMPMHTQSLIPGFLARLTADYPDAEISVFSAFPKELYRMLREEKVDLIISSMAETEDFNISYIPAVSELLLAAVPPEYPVNERLKELSFSAAQICAGEHEAAGCPRVPLSVFTDIPFIVPSGESPFYPNIHSIFCESGFHPTSRISVSAPILAYALARKGFGAALIGSLLVKENDDPLRYYRLRTKMDERPYYFAVRNDRELTAGQKKMIQAFRSFLNSQKL